MTNLTETHLEILASACSRADGKAVRPATLRPAAAAKITAKLIALGLVREVRAKADMPVWREDDQGRRISLAILKAGRLAAYANAELDQADPSSSRVGSAASADDPKDRLRTEGAIHDAGKPGSKRAMVLGLLQRPGGATIQDLMTATGWLPQTTRAALSGLRKAGLSIERSRHAEKDVSIYRLIEVA